MNRNKLTIPLIAVIALLGGAGAGIVGMANAQNTTITNGTVATHMDHAGPGVMGTVASINGNTLTVTGKNSTNYTVDVTSAKVLKGVEGAAPTSGAVSDIKVGDTVGVRGTVSGTSVTATEVMDGVFGRGFGGPGGRGGFGKDHGVMGTVSAINGSTVTITNKDGTSYTVDATNAKVSKVIDLSVSDIQVGDTLGVEGTVSGTSVSATHIMDGIPTFPVTAQ